MKKQNQGQHGHQKHYHPNPQPNFNNTNGLAASNGVPPVGFYHNPHSQQQQQQHFYYSSPVPNKNQSHQQQNLQNVHRLGHNRHNSQNGFHTGANNTQGIQELNQSQHHQQQQHHYQNLNGQSNRYNISNTSNNYTSLNHQSSNNSGKPERRSSYSSSNNTNGSSAINNTSNSNGSQSQHQWFYVNNNNNNQALSKSHQNLVNLNQSDLNSMKNLVAEKINYNTNNIGHDIITSGGNAKIELMEQMKSTSQVDSKESSPSSTSTELTQPQLTSTAPTNSTTTATAPASDHKLHLPTNKNSLVSKNSTSLSPVYEKEKSSIIADMLSKATSEMDLKSEDSTSNLSADKKSYSSSESLDVVFRSNCTLSDIIHPESKYESKSEYYKDVVCAIDQLYPDYKWPLHDTWTFSYIKHDNSIKNWSDRIMTFMDVSYVEDFWSAATYLFNVPGLTAGGDLTFFKKGIKPEWEDSQNRSGGCWLYQMAHQHQNKKIEDLWLETLMGLIGDNFCEQSLIKQLDPKYEKSESEHVCDIISGTILMHRGKNEKISLWTKDYKEDHSTRLIGKIWKNLLNLNDTVTINFEAHETKNNKNTSIRIAYKE